MKLINPIQMNDWEINKFLKFIMILQVSLLTLIVLDVIGIHILILREILSFFVLLFVPGILIIRIMKLHKMGNIETLLYSVGLSIFFLMVVGFFMNMIYPIFGLSKPLSLTSVSITFSVLIFSMLFLSYKIDGNFSDPSFFNTKDFPVTIIIFLCLIPFLAIFGSYLMTFYKINIFSFVMILLIGLVVLLTAFGKIPKKFYPLTVFIISISLLYHISLISTYLYGWDIQHEYYLATLVVKNAYWDFTINSQCNAMLSVVMLPPLYSIISDMNLIWIFKIIYPFIFSLVPLGLYNIFEKQTDSKIAFLSVFIFISFFAFYNDMLGLARQEIGEFFIILILLTIFVKKPVNKKISLYLILGISLILSHYTLVYLFIMALIIMLLFSFLTSRHVFMNLIKKSNSFPSKLFENFFTLMNLKQKSFILPLLGILLTCVVYYQLVAGSTTTGIIKYTAHQILIALLNGADVTELQGMSLISGTQLSPLHSVAKYMYLLTQFFIVVGFLKVLSEPKNFKFKNDFFSFAFVNLIFLVAGILVPFFASAMNTQRLYQLALITLAPFCVIGGLTSLKLINKIINLFKININSNRLFQYLSIFFVILFLFNSSLIYYVSNDNSNSIALNVDVDNALFDQQEVFGAKWIHDFGIYNNRWEFLKDNPIVTDYYNKNLLSSFGFQSIQFSDIYGNNSTLSDMQVNLQKEKVSQQGIMYIYLGKKDLSKNSVLMPIKNGVNIVELNYKSLSTFSNDENEIYDSKGSQIYYGNYNTLE